MTTNKDFWDNTLEHCSKKDKDYIASVLCKQIIYERDLAIQQLKDLGYGLGEKPKENKGDLISRYQAQAKLKEICERFGYLYDDRYGEGSSGYVFIHAFDDVPSVENKGKWISHYDEDAKEGWYECSCCHSERAFNTNFCPDCGANMRGKAE